MPTDHTHQNPREDSPRGDFSDTEQAQSRLQQEFADTLAIGEAVMATLSDSVDLLRLEAALTIASVPKLLGAWLLALPAILLCWFSFSVLIAWAVFEATKTALLGFSTLFFLQVIMLVTLLVYMKRVRKRMTFRHSRQNAHRALRALSEQLSPNTSSEQPQETAERAPQ